MIPFTMLSGQLNISEYGYLEIRVIELSPDSFTFRLPKNMKDIVINSVRLSFLQCNPSDEESYKKYVDVYMDKGVDFTIENVDLKEFYATFYVNVSNITFKGMAEKLSKEYLSYIEDKLYLDNDELVEKYTLYREDNIENFGVQMKYDRYALNINEQRKYFEKLLENRKSTETTKIKKWEASELGVCFDNDEVIELYLRNDLKSFYKLYWEKGLNISSDLSKVMPKRIYVGNAFCEALFPNVQTLKAVIKKALDEKINISVVLAPTSESFFEVMVGKLEQIHRFISFEYKRNKASKEKLKNIEIIANDEGILETLKSKNLDCFTYKKGILLCKKKKDTRAKYISRVNNSNEYSACIDIADGVMYLPFYQMNTATFCTLNALAINGNRGENKRVLECKKYCKNYLCLYPIHMNMIGRYNSLFGINDKILKDEFVFDNEDECVANRIALNLWI